VPGKVRIKKYGEQNRIGWQSKCSRLGVNARHSNRTRVVDDERGNVFYLIGFSPSDPRPDDYVHDHEMGTDRSQRVRGRRFHSRIGIIRSLAVDQESQANREN